MIECGINDNTILLKKAYKFAVSKLAARDYPELELKKLLVRKGFSDKVAAEAVGVLKEKGYIKEEELAVRYAASLLEKGIGRLQISMRMRNKSFDENAIDKAVVKICTNDNEYAAARKTAEKKIRSMDISSQQAAKARLSRFLYSRGFNADLVRQITDELME